MKSNALKTVIYVSALLFVITVSIDCRSRTEIKPLTVYAAASLATLIPQLAGAYQQQHEGLKFEFNFAASSILAKQIEFGASPDLYFSANPQWMDYLESRGMLKPATKTAILRNTLVVIIPQKQNSPITVLSDLAHPSVRKIALGDWSHVPAGIYAKSALEGAGIWSAIESKCIPAVDVRAALTYVERKEVDCGIVYRTDAAASQKVEILNLIPENIAPEIIYPVAITKDSQHPLANDFLDFLRSDVAAGIIRENGFGVVKQNPQN